MLEIKKIATESGINDILLSDCDNIFKIIFGGNGDLYWGLYPKNSTKLSDKCEITEFLITKENYEIYRLFSELYNDIDKCEIFNIDDFSLLNCETEEQIKEKIEQYDKWNKEERSSETYLKLFNNGIISWYSDDYDYEDGNSIDIKKEQEQFIIKFNFVIKNNMYDSSWIRFRNSGSKYNPFNRFFMKMFNKLQEYDTEYHQIHLEEYNYQKTLKK